MTKPSKEGDDVDIENCGLRNNYKQRTKKKKTVVHLFFIAATHSTTRCRKRNEGVPES